MNHVFKRIAASNGRCAKDDIAATGLMLGKPAAIGNGGQTNPYMTRNIRAKRSKTNKIDSDPNLPDALEVAGAGTPISIAPVNWPEQLVDFISY